MGGGGSVATRELPLTFNYVIEGAIFSRKQRVPDGEVGFGENRHLAEYHVKNMGILIAKDIAYFGNRFRLNDRRGASAVYRSY